MRAMREHIDIIRSLLGAGMTQSQIGAEIGKSQAWVAAVLGHEFQDIKWGDGIRLRELAERRGVSLRDNSKPQESA